MRVLVTGSSGFIGSRVAAALVAGGHEVRGFSRTLGESPSGIAAHIRGDLRDERAVGDAVRGCDAVFHVAALYSYSRAQARAMHEVNVLGTGAVLAAARAAGNPRVVLTSSAATCGPVPGRAADEGDQAPDWELCVPYKRTKCAAERAALEAARAGQDVVVVNPATVIGPGDRRPSPTGRMVADVVRGRMWGYMRGMGLCVVDVDDVARGHLLAHARGRAGERYILGGENVGLRDLFASIARAAGVAAPRLGVPRWVAASAAAGAAGIAAATGREPTLLNPDEVRLARLPQYFASERARRELGYSFRGLEEAAARAVSWLREQERPREAGAPPRLASPPPPLRA